jgi:hypothetical protein
MGQHENEAGIRIIFFITELGKSLGYHVGNEEYMLPGNPNSPILDITWRRNEGEKHPLFIFEVESSPTKSSVDNALKVFSRKTEVFPKPLFFFHIFVERPIGTDRVEYLRDNYDKLNYGNYLFDNFTGQFQLISDILDQHFRVMEQLNLYSLINLLETENPSTVTSFHVLERLVNNIGYDRFSNARFIETLEEVIIDKGYQSVRQFYSPDYLLRHLLSCGGQPAPIYDPPYYICNGYSIVIHYALALLITEDVDYKLFFDNLTQIEATWQPWGLWEPYFGLSHDYDMTLLAEFPLLLTMLCAAFSPSPYASYFSGKLKDILANSFTPKHVRDMHGWIWLSIASQIAKDQESYEFARSVLNNEGGVPLRLIYRPPVAYYMDADQYNDVLEDETSEQIPAYQDWKAWLTHVISDIGIIDILPTVIGGFLVMKQWEEVRALFAAFCLRKSFV